MPLLWRFPLTFVLAITSIGVWPLNSVCAQERSLLAQSSRAMQSLKTTSTLVPLTLKLCCGGNIKSVLGIEVRSSHQRNIGRIVDLLVDPNGGVTAAVVEFGGFLGIGTRKIAIAWPDLRFDSEGKKLTAILDIPRDQLRAAPEYKPDAPAIVTKVTEPVIPSTAGAAEQGHRVASARERGKAVAQTQAGASFVLKWGLMTPASPDYCASLNLPEAFTRSARHPRGGRRATEDGIRFVSVVSIKRLVDDSLDFPSFDFQCSR